MSTLVRDHVGRNVTLYNILPGPLATDRLIANFAFRARQQGISADEAIAARRTELPARRFGEPRELGQLCAYLCSAQAGYISGQSILIDGDAHPQIL